MLGDDLSGRLVIIDLEDVKWLKRPRALEPTSGNTRRNHRVGGGEYKDGLKRMEMCDIGITFRPHDASRGESAEV